jgi:3-(3-hydroxy-phenyl)propionate hydroxylase
MSSPYQDIDVAIVGFGPVGATLAGLLGQRGVKVAVFDRLPGIYPLPRAFALDQEAMRTLQQVGIADAMAPHMTPYRPTVYQGREGQAIQRFDMGPGPYPLGWLPAYTFNQPALETALRRAVTALPTVRACVGHEVTRIAEDNARVHFDVRDPAGEVHAGSARYLVGCDGGSSFTRKAAGMSLRSLEFDEPWVVVDMHVNRDKLDTLPQTNIQHCDPRRPCTYVVGPGTHRRWEFMLNPGEAQGDLAPAALWQLLAPWLKPGEAEIWRAATYRFHAVVANQWRRGRLLLAGDSAHQMPPFLAQGMCQGMRDANNLAWKLAWAVQGRAPDSLLDSYGAERDPQVEETTRIVKSLGQLICQRDPALAAARDAELLALQGGEVKTRLRQELLPGVRHGLIDTGSKGAGTPFPQPRVRRPDGHARLMDELLPRGFLLCLRQRPTAAQLQALQPALAAIDGCAVVFDDGDACPGLEVLNDDDGLVHRWMEVHDGAAVLVRPDHLVFGTAADTAGALALLQRAATALGIDAAS